PRGPCRGERAARQLPRRSRRRPGSPRSERRRLAPRSTRERDRVLADPAALVVLVCARPGTTRKPVVVGEPGSLGAAADTELAVDVRQVVFDRLLTEPEFRGDLFIRTARRDAFQDLAL